MKTLKIIYLRSLCFIQILLLFMCLASCGVNDERKNDFTGQNPFSSETINNENVMYAYGFGLVSPEADKVIEYADTPIEIEYYIDNVGTTISTGMSMFLNGIPQPYYVEESPEETYMHIQEVPGETIKKVKITFTPVIGRPGDILDLRFISILNPQIKPNKLDYIFAHTNAMTTFLPRKLSIVKNSLSNNQYLYQSLPKQRDMTKDELDKVKYVDSRGNEVNKLRIFNFSIANPENPSINYFDSNNFNVIIQGYGGPVENYLLIPYINHKAYNTKNLPGILSVEKGDKLFEYNISININDIDKNLYEIEDYNTFYMIAIPLSESSDTDPIISRSFVFKGE